MTVNNKTIGIQEIGEGRKSDKSIDSTKRLILILGALIALSPFSIDMYLPAFPAIAKSLNISIAEVGYSLTSYYAGLCIGQLIYGILIDRFGRKTPLLLGLEIYVVAAVICAFSGNVDLLVTARLLMALGGCVGMVAARAVVRDVFSTDETAKILSILVLVMGVAPIIAPTIGGFVNSAWGWRWVFGIMGMIGLLMLIVVNWLFPETKEADTKVSTKINVIAAGYWAVLKNRSFLIYALAGGLSYAGMYAYIAGSPSVFMEQFGFSSSAYGWAFAFNACGLIAGSQLNRLALKKHSSSKLCKLSGLMLFITGLILVTFPLVGLMTAISTLVLTFLFLFWLGFINPNTTALGLAPFSQTAGRASALLGSIQMVAGVIASWLVSFLDHGTLITMPAVMFGCSLITILILYLPQKSNKKNISTNVTL